MAILEMRLQKLAGKKTAAACVQDAGIGDGPVDAALKAIDRLTHTRGKLLDYSLRAVSQGKDALGEVTVKVSGEGEGGRSQEFAWLMAEVLAHSRRHGAFVAQDLELLSVAGDGAALLDFETAKSHADAAGTAGQRVGIASGLAVIDGRRSA